MTRTQLGSEAAVDAFDPASDLPAMIELISAVNRFDAIDWFPTPEELELDWAPSARFDPVKDLVVAREGARIVAAARHAWRERDGAIVHAIEVWVRPEHRRRALGRRLLAETEARARAVVAAGGGGSPDLPHVLNLGGPTHVAAVAAFAEAAGYVAVRYAFVMRRDLAEPIPDAPLPRGIETRPVTPEQHRQIWDADAEAFLDHWNHSVRTEEDFAGFFAEPDHDTSMWQVAWDGNEVAGSVMNTIYRHENEQTGLEVGWLDHVSVRRAWRGRGLGGALIARSLRVLRERGMAIAALGVDAENPTGALGLYERFGFRVHQTFATFRKPL